MANDVLYQQRLQEARRRLEGAEQRLEDMRRNQAGMFNARPFSNQSFCIYR